MGIRFNHVAYPALEVCNAVDMAAVDALIWAADLPVGARALDIGAGNAAVAIRLAERFGLEVVAVEGDPVMAGLARARIAAAGATVRLVEGLSGDVLAAETPFDLIVSIGATEPAGGGLRVPADMLTALAARLVPGGRLLWGDTVWKGEPPAPLRQLMEMTNLFADDAGWRAAAASAGLEVIAARLSSDAEWDRYTGAMQAAAAAWLEAHPDHEDAAVVRRGADRVRMMFDFGRPHIDFGLYLLGRPA